MDLATIKLILNVLMFFVKLFTKNGENQKKMDEFQKIMHQKGMASVELRLNATDQLDEIDQAWADEEKNDLHK